MVQSGIYGFKRCFKMIRFKDISIPKPCSVDYDALPGDAVKRFCGSCEKQVYDFRGKDESYLNEVWQKTGHVCGVYYEDQIRRYARQQQPQRRFYHVFMSRIIAAGLMLKTFFYTYNTQASLPHYEQTEQQSVCNDTVKVWYRGNPAAYYVNIDLYIDDVFIKSYTMLKQEQIYLPDTIQPEQKIKIIASITRYNSRTSDKKILRRKRYNFKFKHLDNVTVRINYNKKITFIRKRRRTIMGLYTPSDFW